MIKVIKTGLLCSIQDGGRFGYRHMGVPISGWVDDVSALKANAILSNSKNDALIEMGPIGMELLFLEDTSIAICGAPKQTTLNDEVVSYNSRVNVIKGDLLKVKAGNQGVWTYLAVGGGIQNDVELGSRSFYSLADLGLNLVEGTVLPFKKSYPLQNGALNSRIKPEKNFNQKKIIRVNKGPEFEKLNEFQKALILNQPFTIGFKSDRMGYYLESVNSNSLKGIEGIITSVVSPGTIQLPPSGIPIALMKDSQTTGGYARIFQIIQSDLAILAQKRPNGQVFLSLNG